MKNKFISRVSINLDKNDTFIGFDTWHRINGKYVHIAQVIKKGKTIFYTNGKKEK